MQWPLLLVVFSAHLAVALVRKAGLQDERLVSVPHVLRIPLRHQKLDGRKTLSMFALRGRSGGPSSTNSINLQEHGHAYYAPIALGSDGQQLNVLFDTGSANLVVPSTDCVASGCRNRRGGSSFDPAKSTSGTFVTENGDKTDKDHARNLAIGYASGKVAGLAFEDRLCLGDSVCANNTKFLLAEYESDEFAKYEFDGILGLAPGGPLSMGMGFSVLDELSHEGALPERIFALYLSADDGESEVTIGGYDKDRAVEEMTWLKVNTMKGAWQVHMSDVTVGGKTQSLCSSSFGCIAELDSGCAGIGMPKGMSDALAIKIGFTAAESQCRNPDGTLPTLGFVLGGKTFELSPSEYVEISKKDPNRCRLHFNDMAGARSTVSSPVILGHPFLLRYYSVYDREFLRVGLASVKKAEGADDGPAAAAMRSGLKEASSGYVA